MPAPYKVTFAYRDFFGDLQHSEMKQPFPFLMVAMKAGTQLANDLKTYKGLVVHIEDEHGFICSVNTSEA